VIERDQMARDARLVVLLRNSAHADKKGFAKFMKQLEDKSQ